jgi:low temperature requirement protein LtrA
MFIAMIRRDGSHATIINHLKRSNQQELDVHAQCECRQQDVLSSQGIIRNTRLFALNFKCFLSLLYPSTADLYKHSVRFSFINVGIGQPISRSLGSDVHIHFIHLTHHTSLLPLIFISFRIIAIQLNCGHSKITIGFNRSVH